jgi:mono/diheme cytochrome c family protein
MRDKVTRAKKFAAAFFMLPLVAGLALDTAAVSTRASDEDVAATYKAKCAMCHGTKAEKYFDPAKSDEVFNEAVLNGVKPKMPGYATKGMTAEQSKALVEYMKSLRKQ